MFLAVNKLNQHLKSTYISKNQQKKKLERVYIYNTILNGG